MGVFGVQPQNGGGTKREKRAPMNFRFGQHLGRGRRMRTRLRHSSNVDHTQAIKARSHGAEDAARRVYPADAATACEVNDLSERSLSLIGRGRHLPQRSNHFPTTFVATLAPRARPETIPVRAALRQRLLY